jgi:uncharacterized protein YjiS (DUF1127 family)
MNQLTHSESALRIVIENLNDKYKKYANNVRLIQQKRQTRKQLGELPDYLLRDLGLNYDEAQSEVNKSFRTFK